MPFPHRKPLLALAAAAALTGGLAIETASASAGRSPIRRRRRARTGPGTWRAGQSFSNVSGSWTVPTVNSNSNDGYSAFWVGIGGAGQQSQALEQVGTSSDVQNGHTRYYAWYELVPNPETQLDLPVHPGDHMTGKVTVNGTTVTISLSDQTTGKSVTKTLQDSNPDTSSAEWIAEAPSSMTGGGNTQVLPLADFGKVTFTNASATAGGHTGPISDPSWTAQPVDLTPSSSVGLPGAGSYDVIAGGAQSSAAGASTSGLSADGSTFGVSYSSSSDGTATTGASGDPGYGYGSGDPGYGYGSGDPGYGYGSGDPGYGSGDPGYGFSGGGAYIVVPY